jgi:hypothetical protein
MLGVDGVAVSEVSSPNGPATVNAGGPYAVAEGDSLYLAATGSDANGDALTYTWDLDDDGQFDDMAGQVPYVDWIDLLKAGVGDGPGAYPVAVRANDRRGSTAVSHTTLTVANTPPTYLELRGPDSVADGGRAIYSAIAYDPAESLDPLVFSWSVTRDEDGSTVAGGTGATFSFTSQGIGQYTVRVAVSDGDNESTASQALSVVENSAPVFDLVDPGYPVEEGQPFVAAGTFVDANSFDTTHRVTVDWGDGTQPTIFLPGAQYQDHVVNGYINPANGHAYYLLDALLWDQAEAYAQTLGGHLVSIQDAAEQDWVWQTFGYGESGDPQTIGIGLTDSDAYTTDGNFVWTTGEPFTYANFHEGEPNNFGGDEDFGTMDSRWSGEWNDSGPGYFRTVMEADTPYQFPRGDWGYERWFQVPHRYADEGDGDGHYDIHITVTDEAGASATAVSETTVSNAPAIVGVDSWAVDEEGKDHRFNAWLMDSGLNDTWTVTVDYGDGSGVLTLHPTEPGFLGLSHVYADEGSYVARFTAQDNDSSEPTEMLTAVEISNVSPRISKLALTPVAEEGEAVTLSAMVGDPGDDAVTVSVDWGDGGTPDVYPAPAGAPKPFAATHAYADDGTYNVTVTVSDGDGGEVVKTSAGQLPDMWTQWEVGNGGAGHIYGKVYVPEHNAYAAYALAEDMGGYLVTITSAEEQQFLNDTFLFSYPYGDPYTSYWIGLTDAAEEGNFKWVTGEPLTFTNWRQGEPSDFGAGEDFAVMNWHYSTGQFPSNPGDWNDVDEVHSGGWPPDYAIVEFDQVPQPLTVTVTPAAPAVDAGGDGSAREGAAFARSGSFADGGDDAWAATVDYGDGSGVRPLALNPDKTFDLSHVYADNGTYAVTVHVTDTQDHLDGVASFNVAVANVAPTVAVSGPATGVRGQARQFGASVFDPGVLDTHAVTWRVLRGTTVVASGTGVLASFTPVDVGFYKVEFTATDDDSGVGSGSSTIEVKVWDVQPDPANAGKTVLAVGGTSAGDTVVVKPRSGGNVDVILNDVVLGTFKPTGGISIFGGAGNDRVVVNGPLPVPLTFFGGDGDDLLRSDNPADTLIGGPGDDRVLGSARNA